MQNRTMRVGVAVVACALLVSACTATTSGAAGGIGPGPGATVPTGTAAGSSASPGSSATPSGHHQPVARRDKAGTVWLCRPGIRNNPCAAGLTSTSVDAAGTATVEPARAASDPPIDCFYVYPTVSKQRRISATLRIQKTETEAAIAQASRFSQVCRVYAPMYRQLTESAIATGGNAATFAGAVTAYRDVAAAWHDYLAHFNHGRGVVFIGHSQGAFLLTGLLQREVDRVPATRKLLVSAILPGGNVTVPQGRRVGGAFRAIPSCASRSETGCVIAYSTFDTEPAGAALFGRAATSIGSSLGLGGTGRPGAEVLCVNPAALAGRDDLLEPYFPRVMGQTPSDVQTRWVTFPDEYRASCQDRDGASWLQVDRTSSTDSRPAVEALLGDTWGLHTFDVNLALGNLVRIVRAESRAYAR
jgi:hypothetical protein